LDGPDYKRNEKNGVRNTLDRSFIGRGENRVKEILQRLFPDCKILPQIALKSVIRNEDFAELDEVYQKHKIDFVISNQKFRYLAAV
jgi:hypothetical protein